MREQPLVPNVNRGDRAVAICGFIAFLVTGFFGDEPDQARIRTAPPAGNTALASPAPQPPPR